MTKTELLNAVEMMLHQAKCAGVLEKASALELTLHVPLGLTSDPFDKKIKLDAEQVAKLSESL